jgi:hypothetical protein
MRSAIMGDVLAGDYTGAQSTTTLGAQLPDPNIGFNGSSILVVTPIGTNTDGLTPRQQLNGIVGVGCDAGFPAPGGVGVTGLGSPNQGTGVVGQGGIALTFNNSQTEVGAGGIGVNGIGGAGLSTATESVEPGPGVLGQGGTPGANQAPGAGVVGLAGGLPVPPANISEGVGVFGQGTRAGVVGLGPEGVIGQGNTTGVSGIGRSAGVAGTSTAGDGVAGASGRGTGVHGKSELDRGGRFESVRAPQVQLTPARIPVPMKAGGIPSILRPAIPGVAGDLLAVTHPNADGVPVTTLWFHTSGDPLTPWRQVSLI